MCGIYGIFYESHDIYNYILNGLTQLQNRGYDSAGLCVLKDESFHILKSASGDPLKTLREQITAETITMGMGHNRWATHGDVSEENAHPHVSNDKRWSIVHNGIINNYYELKTMLINKGYTFYSDTDTEVIVNLLQYNFHGNSYGAIQTTIKMLQGTYGLIIMTLHEQEIMYCVKNGSPLLVGYDEKVIITSEKSGFGCNLKYIILNNNDICLISKECIMTSGSYKEYDNIVTEESIHFYDHWTLKEIYEQPQIVLQIKPREHTLNAEHVIILGCGTSYYAGLYGAHLLKQARRHNTVQVFDGADFSEKDIPKGFTAFIFISQSGETRDLFRCLKIANGLKIGIINVEDSLIARAMDQVIYCNAGKEVGVASTKSFTSQVVCLAMLAGLNVNLKELSTDIQSTIDICNPICKEIAGEYTNMFLLGKGTDEIIAKEGALKLKEIAYIHAEGYSASSLKHGPFALLDENMPVILLDLQGGVSNCYHEIKSRNAPILLITNKEKIDETDILIPKNEIFSSLLGIIPLQLLAYYISLKKGINPDKPKNLAKVVTVE